MLAGSPARLSSGLRGVQVGPTVQGGVAGPARARGSWLTGLAEDLVAPVAVGDSRELMVAAADWSCLGGAGLALFPVRRPAATRPRPGLLFRLARNRLP